MRWICFVLGSLFLVGCTPLGSIDLKIPPDTAFGEYSVALLEVTVAVEEDIPEVRRKLDNLVLVELRRASVFHAVHRASEVAAGVGDLRIDVAISRYRKVPSILLTIFTVLAGRHRVAADVRVTEVQSGRVVAEFQVEGSSARGNVYSDGIDQAVEACAATIVGFIRSHR